MSGTGNRVSPLQVSTLESILNVLKSDNGEGNKESNKESKPTRILVSPKNDSKVLNQKFSQAQFGKKELVDAWEKWEEEEVPISPVHYFSWIFDVFLIVAFIGLYTLVPQHNMLEYPGYWYEYLIVLVAGYCVIVSAQMVLQSYYRANMTYAKDWTSLMIVYIIATAVTVVSFFAYYYVWTEILGLYPPMPFIGYLTGSLSVYAIYATLWFRMPYDERNDKGFQKRFGYFVASGTLDLITMWVYIFFLNAFLDIEKKYQPILGLISPIIKHVFIRALLPLAYKAAGSSEIDHVKIECYNYTEARYAVFFATIMGCVASPITSWCVMGLNYTLCVYDGLKIVFKYKKEGHSNTLQEKLEHLTLAERVETIIPFTYLICFLMAYYGPNGDIIGCIKLIMWQHQAVSRVDKYMRNLSLFTLVGASSFLTNAIILWFTCKINIVKTLQKVQSKFWLYLAIQESCIFFLFFEQMALGNGQDNTFQFDWIDGNGVVNETIGAKNYTFYT